MAAAQDDTDVVELDLATDPRSLANVFRSPIREDPWGRWPAGEEPVREVEIEALFADESGTLLVRTARVEIEAGVLPDPRPLDEEYIDEQPLQFLGRWNARWRGTHLADLSLDLFSDQWPEVLRIRFDAAHPVDLQAAYAASFPGLWGITVCNHGTPLRNARDQPLGHKVTCRDPRLAVQIGARCPGIAPHQAYLEVELARPSELISDEGKEQYAHMAEAAAAVSGEPAPGLRATLDDNLLRGVSAMVTGDAEPPMVPFVEIAGSTLDTYTLIGALTLGLLGDARLVRCDHQLTAALSSHITFAHAIAEIRRTAPDRLPLWLDFTDADGQPLIRSHGGELAQPLYGVLIAYEDDPDEDGPFHAAIPVGRSVAMGYEPVPLCGLAVGGDDTWRYPLPDDRIGLITAHRGGVVVRNTEHDRDLEGVEPPLRKEEIRREIAGHFARTTEWVLARVGAVLAGLREGALDTRVVPDSTRTYDLVPVPRPATRRRARTLDAMVIAARLRELGSLREVAQTLDADIRLVHETLGAAGIDPDQVRRDEVLRRFRAAGSVEAVAARYPVLRGDIERFLREAGLDPSESPVPHDVTNPDVLAAIHAYRAAGTLEAAGEQLGVRGETIRRRIARAGLAVEDVDTDAARREREATVDAWNAAGQSLAGASRALGIDPRTVRERLLRASIPEATIRAGGNDRGDEIRQLHGQLGSARAVAAVTGLSLGHVRRQLTQTSGNRGRGRGGPRVSDHALDQAELAYAEHGSIRAAARALGVSPGGLDYRLKLARARHQTPPDEPATEVS